MTLATDIEALAAKYAALIALRELHDRSRREPGFEEPDPRAALVALSRRYPGALRELDTTPLDVLRERHAALLAVASGPAEAAAPWMRAQCAFHRLARGALATKRWLGATRNVNAAARVRFAAALASGALEPDASEWLSELEALARPPRGRVLDLVFERAAVELGVHPARVRELVFWTTPPRRGT